MNNTYSFIATYRGGTYLQQVEAADLSEALFVWAEKTAADPDIEHLDGNIFRQTFETEIGEYPPAPIDGCPNIWHLFYFSGRNRMDVHIVKTSKMPEFVSAEQFMALQENL